jgi:hypothetical protein
MLRKPRLTVMRPTETSSAIRSCRSREVQHHAVRGHLENIWAMAPEGRAGGLALPSFRMGVLAGTDEQDMHRYTSRAG